MWRDPLSAGKGCRHRLPAFGGLASFLVDTSFGLEAPQENSQPGLTKSALEMIAAAGWANQKCDALRVPGPDFGRFSECSRYGCSLRMSINWPCLNKVYLFTNSTPPVRMCSCRVFTDACTWHAAMHCTVLPADRNMC